MDKDSFDMYLQNLDEYVKDENRIVTYKWLSQMLGIHVNTAKQLLQTYATDEKGIKPGLHLTYLVVGLLPDGKNVKVQVVRQEELEQVKTQLKVVIAEHIYSVQKPNSLKDLNVLYGAGKDLLDEVSEVNWVGPIQCAKGVQRSPQELAHLRIKAHEETAVKSEWPADAPKAAKPLQQKPQAAAVASKTGGKRAGGIASMFAAQSKKPRKEETETTESTAKKPVENSSSKKGISNFFTSRPPKPEVEVNCKNKENGASLEEVDSNKAGASGGISSGKEENGEQVEEPKQEEAVKEQKTKKSKMENGKNKRKPSKTITEDDVDGKQKATDKKVTNGIQGKAKKSAKEKNLPQNKQRKRIRVMSDSESSVEDMFDREEREDRLLACEEEELRQKEQQQLVENDEDVIPATPQPQANGKRRVRKLVDKTFMDEDGFVLTRKEYEYVSCSEEEAEHEKENERKTVTQKNQEKKPTQQKSKSPPVAKASPKKVSPQKKKQSTLMNFFQKR